MCVSACLTVSGVSMSAPLAPHCEQKQCISSEKASHCNVELCFLFQPCCTHGSAALDKKVRRSYKKIAEVHVDFPHFTSHKSLILQGAL